MCPYSGETNVHQSLEIKDTHYPWGAFKLLGMGLQQGPTAVRVLQFKQLLYRGYLAHKKLPPPMIARALSTVLL